MSTSLGECNLALRAAPKAKRSVDDQRGRRRFSVASAHAITLLSMRAFAEAWPDPDIVQWVVGRLPWGQKAHTETVAGCNLHAGGCVDFCADRRLPHPRPAVPQPGRGPPGARRRPGRPWETVSVRPARAAAGARRRPGARRHPSGGAGLAATHWGVTDRLRQAALRPGATAGRRLPRDHAVIGYGFFTSGETPHRAITTLGACFPALRFALVPRPAD